MNYPNCCRFFVDCIYEFRVLLNHDCVFRPARQTIASSLRDHLEPTVAARFTCFALSPSSCTDPHSRMAIQLPLEIVLEVHAK